LGDSFAAYLNTADGQQRIAAGLSNVMNVDAVQQQMMTAIQQYMQQAMTQMGNKLQSAMASGMQVDEEAFLNAFQINMNEDGRHQRSYHIGIGYHLLIPAFLFHAVIVCI